MKIFFKHLLLAPSSTRTEKQTEDCCVVWSSSPSTSADNCQRHTSNAISRLNQLKVDPNLLFYDKILVDTTADMTNLRFLSNENNKPKRKNNHFTKLLSSKSSKVSKLNSKTAESLTTKRTLSRVTKHVSSTTTTTTSAVKKKSQNKGELIYQAADTSTSEEKKKATKGSPREIVIDGNNVAMA